MKYAVELGKPFGIRVSVHWTFLLIIAWVVFMLVKMVNRVKEAAEKEEEAPAAEEPKGPTQEELLMEIRDALKAQS